MKEISIEELKEKIKAGESIEKIAKKYKVYFPFNKGHILEDIPGEKLIEILEKAPELLAIERNIPAWLFLLLLAKERFDLVDNIVSDVFKKEKDIIGNRVHEKENSNTFCKTLSLIKRITKEQISELLSIIEKRKGLLFGQGLQDFNVRCLVEDFLEPLKDYISEECFLPVLNWVVRETSPYFLRYLSSDSFKKLPIDSQFMQENIANYFILASSRWLFWQKYDWANIFIEENTKKINIEYFVSSVVKSYSKLQGAKRVYLLNFPYFVENYPQLVVKSLKAFIRYRSSRESLFWNTKFFISNEIWDALAEKEPLLFIDLIKEAFHKHFYFDIDYVAEKAKLPLFLYPEESEEVYDSLNELKKSSAKLANK